MSFLQSARSRCNRAKALLALSVASLVVPTLAYADPFTLAMTEAGAKVTTYAGAMVTLGAVAVIFMIALKYVKKIPRAA